MCAPCPSQNACGPCKTPPAPAPLRCFRRASRVQAGSLAAALDDHDELPDLGEVSDHLSLTSNRRRARRIAVCTMGLTVLFMLGMVHLMHRSLREMREDHRAKEESETETEAVSRVPV